MINDPKFRDPLYPRDPGLGNNADRPEISSGSGRTSLAVAVMLIALLVVGLVTFSGPSEDIDPTQTATPGIDSQQEEILPPANRPAPDAVAPAEEAPAAVPQENEPAPTE
ncbi:MAG: hypothetical protein WDZ83_05400 [Rhizobiaceae bacterium]